MRKQMTLRTAAVVTAMVTALFGVMPRAQAMVVPAGMASDAATADRASDLKLIQSTLENKMVRHRLNELGLTDQEIDQRLERLSDAQLHQAALHIKNQTAAGHGDSEDLVVGILLIAILVALFFWLLDALD